MKTFDEILPAFLAEIGITIKHRGYMSYTGSTKVFSAWLSGEGLSDIPMREISPDAMAKFFVYLATERDLDRPTCQKYFMSIRKVFQYAQKRGEVDKLPFDLIVFPHKKEDKSSQVITPDHMKLLLPRIKEKDPQLYLAVMTQFYCFLRPGGELRLLKVKDIDFNNSLIQVPQDHAKNGHKRIVTIPNQLLDLLKEQEIDKADGEYYVFGNKKIPGATALSINMLRYRFNQFRDTLGLPKGYKLYSWKHNGCTTLHNSNVVSLHELMTQLGHSRLSATEHYIKKYAGFINTKIRENFPNPY
jgi:integrase